jgi:hypothetical protein
MQALETADDEWTGRLLVNPAIRLISPLDAVLAEASLNRGNVMATPYGF